MTRLTGCLSSAPPGCVAVALILVLLAAALWAGARRVVAGGDPRNT